MRQIELHAPKEIRFNQVNQPVPGDDELLISVKRVGICGSDLHAYHGKHPFIQLPVVPGHEFSGQVRAVGKKVSEFEPGDRVTVEPSLVCGVCYNCTHGRYNICTQLKVIGCQTTGAMADFISVPASKAYRLPNEVTYEQAAMVEPLAVGVHAVKVAHMKPGARVLILGGGTIGLMVLQAAKAMGAGPVMVSDLLQQRLKLAVDLGASFTANPGEKPLARSIEENFGADGPDLIFECVGIAATARTAIESARKGTRIILAGVFEEAVPIELGLIQDHEIELVGTLMYANQDFPESIELIRSGNVKVEPIISHHFSLENTAAAFMKADSRRDALKVMIDIED